MKQLIHEHGTAQICRQVKEVAQSLGFGLTKGGGGGLLGCPMEGREVCSLQMLMLKLATANHLPADGHAGS